MKSEEAYRVLQKAWAMDKEAKDYPSFDDINEALYTIKQDLERLEQVKEENKDKNKAFNILNKLCTDQTNLIGKYEKAIEWLKENLNFKIEKHKSSPNCMFVSYKDLQEWLEPSNEIVDLLKEVLGE